MSGLPFSLIARCQLIPPISLSGTAKDGDGACNKSSHRNPGRMSYPVDQRPLHPKESLPPALLAASQPARDFSLGASQTQTQTQNQNQNQSSGTRARESGAVSAETG